MQVLASFIGLGEKHQTRAPGPEEWKALHKAYSKTDTSADSCLFMVENLKGQLGELEARVLDLAYEGDVETLKTLLQVCLCIFMPKSITIIYMKIIIK
mgnify:CR=1 FL=1